MDHKNMHTLDEKLAAGRALRKQTNRQSHREIGNLDRDPDADDVVFAPVLSAQTESDIRADSSA
jgi:hypothetical protein